MSVYGVTAENIREAAFGVTIPPGATTDTQLERLISKAELMLPTPCVQRRVAAGLLPIETVQSVIEDMVIRVTKNPGGHRQRSIDDFQATIDTALSSGRLYLSGEERAQLCPPKRVGKVRSIGLRKPRYLRVW